MPKRLIGFFNQTINMEYFDVLNEEGNKTGVVKSRGEVHRDGDWHRAAHVWAIDSKRELLMQKRAPNKDSHPNKWDMAIGGHLLAGDDSITAAIREAKEELGLDLDKKDLEYLFAGKTQIILNDGKFINNSFSDTYLLKRDFDISEISFDKAEIVELKFISFLELEKLFHAKDSNLVPHDEEFRKLFEILHKRYG